MPWRYLASLLAANLLLLLPPGSPLRVVGALLLIGLLPGLSWANRVLANLSPLLRWTSTAALSFSFTILAVLLLAYLPGPVETWQILIILNILALLPLIPPASCPPLPPISLPLLLILLIALLLRTLNLDYSEFQGDESLAMISAAEALEGHEDALFLRSKGPAEVLLPMALWRLSGVINEPIARGPFTVASLLAIITIYLIGRKIGGERVGWLSAGFFAGNGFMVAFGRIVQYQALVIWFSALAFLLIMEWRETQQHRLALLAGLCLGIGMLAHYDAVLVVPAITWMLVSKKTEDRRPETGKVGFLFGWWSPVSDLIGPALFFMTTLLAALSFYLPFALDPQANRTSDYVGGRIGSELRNNLPDFFHFNTFYSSTYYLSVTGLLALGLLTWLVGQTRWGRWLGVIATIGVLAVILNPTLLAVNHQLDLSILPFVLLLGGAFFTVLSLSVHSTNRITQSQSATAVPPDYRPTGSINTSPTPRFASLLPLILWLAVPFLGYNFIVALGLTHIYTIVPAWSLLAGLGWYHFFDARPRFSHFSSLISNTLLSAFLILSTIFLWNAFIRHDVEYWQDYPAGNLSFYWTPYKELPPAGFFGFAHRAGWKAVGQKIAAAELAGDYSSNEEPDVTIWYTRGAPRACDPQPEFYFLADDLIDPVKTPDDLIASSYEQIGRVTLPNQKQMRIMQLKPNSLTLDGLSDPTLGHDFDQTAIPAVFARSARGSIPFQANFNGLIRLIGYDLDTRRAQPGGRIPVTLFWQALTPIAKSYQVFTHLEGQSGPIAQADGVPVCWSYPTDAWRPGQIIADQHAIQLSPDVPSGDYPLQVGLYLADSFARLDVLDETGVPIGNNVTLTQVRIR